MSRDGSVELDFGDGTYKFRLAINELRELQEKTDVGPMVLLRRILEGSWKVDDVREAIRIGLVGGGLDPQKALRLTRRYVDEVPQWTRNVQIAYAVVAGALDGVEDEQPGKPDGAEGSMQTPTQADVSPSPSSTPLAR